MTRRILLDVDGVLANFAQMAVDWVNKIKAPDIASGKDVRYTVSDIEQWDILEALGCPEQQDAFDSYCNAERVARTLARYPGAKKFYTDLRALGEVVIVTSPFKAAATWECDRRYWLDRYFGIDPDSIVFTSRKELVLGDILIDDRPKNIDDFPGPAVLVERPWNKKHVPEKEYLVYRAASLDVVLDAVRTEFDRQDDLKESEQQRERLLANIP